MFSQLHNADTFKVPSGAGGDPPLWWHFPVRTALKISTPKILSAHELHAKVGPVMDLVL